MLCAQEPIQDMREVVEVHKKSCDISQWGLPLTCHDVANRFQNQGQVCRCAQENSSRMLQLVLIRSCAVENRKHTNCSQMYSKKKTTWYGRAHEAPVLKMWYQVPTYRKTHVFLWKKMYWSVTCPQNYEIFKNKIIQRSTLKDRYKTGGNSHKYLYTSQRGSHWHVHEFASRTTSMSSVVQYAHWKRKPSSPHIYIPDVPRLRTQAGEWTMVKRIYI